MTERKQEDNMEKEAQDRYRYLDSPQIIKTRGPFRTRKWFEFRYYPDSKRRIKVLMEK